MVTRSTIRTTQSIVIAEPRFRVLSVVRDWLHRRRERAVLAQYHRSRAVRSEHAGAYNIRLHL